MTRKQYNKSLVNRNKAWKKICGTPHGIPGYVLHHIDTNMIHDNIERYIEWNLEDLKMMSKAEHARLHRTGSFHTTATKRKIGQALRGIPKSYEHRLRISEGRKRYWTLKRANDILSKAV